MACHAPRKLTLATLLLTGAAGLGTSISVRGAASAATLVARSRCCAGVAMTETSLKQELTMPTRWKNVHDCERPSRWREQVRLLLGQVHVHVHVYAEVDNTHGLQSALHMVAPSAIRGHSSTKRTARSASSSSRAAPRQTMGRSELRRPAAGSPNPDPNPEPKP